MKSGPCVKLIGAIFLSSLLLWGCGGDGGGGGGGQGGGSNLYLACRPADSTKPDRFYLIDAATNAVTQTATFTRDATNNTSINAIAVKPDGSLVYLARTDSNGSTVEIFDGSTGANVGAIALPANALPRAGVVTPDGKTLYVVDQVLGTHVIKTATNTLLLTMSQTKSRGFDIAISPDGTRLYTTLLSSVFVLDATTNTWVMTITGDFTAAYQVTVTPGATALPSVPAQVYLSNSPSSTSTDTPRVVVIDPATNPLEITSIPVTDVPGESAPHPDGRTVYVVVGTGLAVIDVATDVLTTVSGVGDLFNHVVVAPDGKKLYLLYRKSSGTATLEIKVFDLTDPTVPTLSTTISDPSFDGCYAPLGMGIRPG
jgi:YVTN family beta-propeller protein